MADYIKVLTVSMLTMAVWTGCEREPPDAQPHAVMAADGGLIEEPVLALTITHRDPQPDHGLIVDTARELMITDLSVVEDPVRTEWTAPVGTPGRGVWTFGHLMAEMAGSRPPGQLTLDWLREWERDQRFASSVAPARPAIRALVIDPWLEKSGCAAGVTRCELDLTQAPFRLLAIVNRMDLRDTPEDLTERPGGSGDAHTRHAGEGRFVFGALGPAGERLRFTIIFEYTLLADSVTDVVAWAQRWHALGSIPFGADYNAALEAITRDFAAAGLAARRPNGSAIAQVRTNEVALGSPWELREFRLAPSTGALVQAPVVQTPDFADNGTSALGNTMRSHARAILDGSYRVPPGHLGASGPTPTSAAIWSAPDVDEDDVRHLFSLRTCSGCHAGETGTRFLHVGTREPGEASALSGFLIGVNVEDPVSGTLRRFGDLDARAADLAELLTLPLEEVRARRFGRGLNGARAH